MVSGPEEQPISVNKVREERVKVAINPKQTPRADSDDRFHLKEKTKGYAVPRVSVKGQVLADFIVERPEEEGQDDSAKEEEPLPAQWTLFTDGSSCVDGCGAGVILTDPEGVEFTYALRFQFEATNNEAEYEALIAGLRIAEKIGVQSLQVNVSPTQNMYAKQSELTYIAKEKRHNPYTSEKGKRTGHTYRAISISTIQEARTRKTDALEQNSI
ncbi:reverse transcriptase domain-containing protein [Tanacetum coccineum]